MANIDTTARVYVGTYAKYSNGNLSGKWLNLEDFADKADFLAKCAEIHADESDPELMFQDHEGIPEGMISESNIEESVWEWLAMDDDDRELLAVYCENFDADADIERAREAFEGKFDDPEDWAYHWLEETGSLAEVPEFLRNYIDFEAYARDACGDMTFVERGYHDCWVFRNN